MTDAIQAQNPTPILITLAAATLTASLGISIAAVLLPTLTRSFSATLTEVQWVVLAYLTSVTIMVASAGRFGDLQAGGDVQSLMESSRPLVFLADHYLVLHPSLDGGPRSFGDLETHRLLCLALQDRSALLDLT